MIDILLATYNGEKFIKTQIYSILSQSYKNWRLLVHDDQSSDNTINIVHELAQHDNRIILIEDNIKCGSPASNFRHLAKFSTSEYVMFCDQDDIWLDHKIQMLYYAIKKYENDKPVVIYSNAYLWFQEEKINRLVVDFVARRLEDFLFLNGGIQGCSTIFNRSMLNCINSYKGNCAMHDHLLQFIGCAFGHIGFVDTPLLLYRQHQYNYTQSKAFESGVIQRLVKHRHIPVMTKSHFVANIDMINSFYSSLSEHNKRLCKAYMLMSHSNIIIRIFYVMRYGFTLFGSKLKLIQKIFLRKYLE